MQGHAVPGWWCAGNELGCQVIWWCGPRKFLETVIVGILLWIALFCIISLLLYPLVKNLVERRPSKIKEESGATWFAWHVQSTIHASLVTYMALGPIYHLSSVSPTIQLGYSFEEAPQEVMESIGSIGNGSLVFFCYLLVDTLVTIYRKAMTVDYLAHHAVFCFFCIILQYDCYGSYLAGWLLIMEISTIFLNGFSFFRNRLGYGHWLVKAFFLLFGISFFLCRLVGTTHIAVHFCRAVFRQEFIFSGIPRWHIFLVCFALVAAVGIQIFWAWAIVKKLVKVLRSPAAGAADVKGS